MKRIIYTALFAAAAVTTVSCGDSSIPGFNADYNSVRFAGISPDPDFGNNSGGVTRYNFSFVEHPESDEYVYEIPVYVSGNLLEKDTEVNYEVDVENTTAPDGSYVIESAMIPAGERSGAISVRIYKTDELQDEVTYTLALSLLPSSELMISDNRYISGRLTWSNNLPLPTHNHHKYSYNFLMAGTPSFSSTSDAYMSTNGLLAIVAALGWDDWDDPEAHPGQSNTDAYNNYKYLPRYSFIYLNNIYMIYSRMVNEWLVEYEQEHGQPLLHNGGELIGQPVEARYK